MEITFDSNKNLANQGKHGVSFEQAKTVFDDRFLLTVEDLSSTGEARYISTGMNASGLVLTVVWTLRDDGIRLISAWKANQKQRQVYERQY